MFIENKYYKWYTTIIKNAQNRELPINEYTEKHHIIPKCIGGTDELDNIVVLSAKEHFICHMLLTKCVSDNKIKYALVMMTLSNIYHGRYKLNSNSYSYVKKQNSIATTNRLTGKPGANANRKRYHNEFGKACFFNIDDVPDGWIPGFSEKAKEKMRGKNKGRIYYHNPITSDVIAILSDDPIPPGYIKGNPNANTASLNNIRGSTYYHNPITNEEGRFHIQPDGWIKGRSVIWITDGIINALHPKSHTIPYNFRRGKIKK